MSNIIFIYVTYPSQEMAQEVSRVLLEARLVACANISPAHESLYHWDGAVQSGSEIAVIYKTTQDKFSALEAKVLELHSYDCPCIVALPVAAGHDPFLQWIETETKA